MKRVLHSNPSLMFMAIAGMFGIGPNTPKQPAKKAWKPKFTDKELEEVRALPKRQRELRVRELRAQYAQKVGLNEVLG